HGLVFTADGRYLVSACHNGTALVWSVASLAARARAPAEPTAELSWALLADANAQKAGAAVRRLTAAPEAAALIRDRLRPVRAVADATITRLVADLDAPGFAERAAAERELAELAEQAEPALRAAARRPGSAEQRRRVLRLLARIDNPESAPEHLRAL